VVGLVERCIWSIGTWGGAAAGFVLGSSAGLATRLAKTR